MVAGSGARRRSVERRGGRWRWANVPVPEPHVAGLVVGAVLHLLRPVQAVSDPGRTRAVGWASTASGVAAVAWAVWTVGEGDSRRPSALVTTGPYAFSRNPMYVGWTLAYLGVSLLLNSLWPFVLAPAVLATCHRVVRREERALERTFGDEYRAYRRAVRRYL